jgi:nucleoside-diphosphate-sugar epimerase
VVKDLVVGDGGYIGAVLVPLFEADGHEVDGLDLLAVGEVDEMLRRTRTR